MKLTKSQLKKIIKEEVGTFFREQERHSFGLRTPDDKKAEQAGYERGRDMADMDASYPSPSEKLRDDLKKVLKISDNHRLTNAEAGFMRGWRSIKPIPGDIK